jgi:hypothetical protein
MKCLKTHEFYLKPNILTIFFLSSIHIKMLEKLNKSKILLTIIIKIYQVHNFSYFLFK